MLTATFRRRLSLEIFRLLISADITTFLFCGKHPKFFPLPHSLLQVPNMSQHLKWLSQRAHHSTLFPNPLCVIINIASHPTFPNRDGAHPSQTFPHNPELFPHSCLTPVNPESPPRLLLLPDPGSTRCTNSHCCWPPSAADLPPVPRSLEKKSLCTCSLKGQNSQSPPQAESCYPNVT